MIEENLKENKSVKTALLVFKKEMRRNPTPAEKKLRTKLKSLNLRFQFQRIFFSKDFRCIADFYFRTDNSHIVIEVDGKHHNSEIQKAKDEYRTKWLFEKRGCFVLRLDNDYVIDHLDDAVNKIAEFYLANAVHSLSRNYNIFCRLLGRPEAKKAKFIKS